MDAAELGFAAGQQGTLFRLGDFLGEYIECDGHDVHTGHLAQCGTATESGGVVTTTEVDRLHWIGISSLEP